MAGQPIALHLGWGQGCFVHVLGVVMRKDSRRGLFTVLQDLAAFRPDANQVGKDHLHFVDGGVAFQLVRS